MNLLRRNLLQFSMIIALTTMMASALADVSVVAGSINKFKAVESTNNAATTARKFRNVKDMKLSFTTTQKGPLVISFGAVTFAPYGENSAMYVRPKIIGLGSGDPIRFADGVAGDGTTAHSYAWHADEIPAGTHTLVMQWRSASGSKIQMFNRQMRVEYDR